MESSLMEADEALGVGQRVTLHTADRRFQLEAKIASLEDGLTLAVKLADADYANSPSPGQLLFCAAAGDNCVYRFLTKFSSSAMLPDKLWYVDMPEKVQRQQKRLFVRIPLAREDGIRVKFSRGKGSFQDYRSMTLFDISGNGVCFVSEKEAEVGANLMLEVVDLPEFGSLKTAAIVRRCTKVRVLDHYVYHIGASMETHISDKQQDRLVKSLFRLQQEFLKKGVGV